jgi:hypothetical protein
MSPIRVTCKRQVARGMMWKYMHDRLGHVRRLGCCKGKVGDECGVLENERLTIVLMQGIWNTMEDARLVAAALHRGGKGRAANACRLESCAAQRSAVPSVGPRHQ